MASDIIDYLIYGFCADLMVLGKRQNGIYFLVYRSGVTYLWLGVAFGARRMAYKMQQVAASTWNKEREALIKSEIKRGQRFAYLLDAYIETPAGQGASRNLDAINKSVPIVALQPSRSDTQPIRYAPLIVFDQLDPTLMLTDCINNIAVKIKPILQKIPDDIPCYCVLEIDRELQPQAEPILLEILKNKAQTPFA